VSCKSTDSETSENLIQSDGLSEVRLSSYGYPLSLFVDPELAGTLDLRYLSGEGKLVIGCGPECGFYVAEDPLDIQQLKDELNLHPMFTYSFTDEGTESVYFTSYLPDGSEYNHHYARTITHQGRKFLIQTDDQTVMSMYAVRNIAKIIDSIHGFE
jgi:hypothetical protein